jgi:uncharacterized protein (UPF0262 family)
MDKEIDHEYVLKALASNDQEMLNEVAKDFAKFLVNRGIYELMINSGSSKEEFAEMVQRTVFNAGNNLDRLESKLTIPSKKRFAEIREQVAKKQKEEE